MKSYDFSHPARKPVLDSKALDIFEKTGHPFYDSLNLVGALRGGCKILYSEDLHSGHQMDSVIVLNPFA